MQGAHPTVLSFILALQRVLVLILQPLLLLLIYTVKLLLLRWSDHLGLLCPVPLGLLCPFLAGSVDVTSVESPLLPIVSLQCLFSDSVL